VTGVEMTRAGRWVTSVVEIPHAANHRIGSSGPCAVNIGAVWAHLLIRERALPVVHRSDVSCRLWSSLC
jgi:hypothetical protein